MDTFLRKIKGEIDSVKLSPQAKDVLLGIFVGAIIVFIMVLGSSQKVELFQKFKFFQKFEYITLDTMFRLRGETGSNENIVIVGIDDMSLEILGRWPWPREYHATFLQILNRYQPKFVVFDILFTEPQPEGDQAIAEVAGDSKNLYLASYFDIPEDIETISPAADFDIPSLPHLKYKIEDKKRFLRATDMTLPVEPLISVAKGVTVVNAPPDFDGSTRHIPLLIEFGGNLYPTPGLQLACDYLGVNVDDVIVKPNVIILPFKKGDIRIPVDSEGRMLLNFSGPIHTFDTYSYIQLLHDYNKTLEEGTKSILENLKGKIVFVGLAATGSVDLRLTPFSNFYPAVGIHATALSNILERNLMQKSPVIFNIVVILLVSVSLSLFVKRGRKAFVNLAVMAIIFFTYGVLSFLLFVFLNFWVYTFTPLLTILLSYVVISIGHYEAVRYEKKILENELLIARRIQQSFLPKSYLQVPFLEFAAECNPAKHVGGDLYDFVELEGGKIGIVIGDVSGKGVPAALYMARTISEFRTASRIHSDAAETLKSLNDVFAREGMEKSFITMQYLMADLKSKKLFFSNGGHNTLLHFINKEKRVEELDTEGGMPIGLVEGIDFDNKEIYFDKGDLIFLYTDGISEAMDRRHRQFGLDRVKGILVNNSEMKAKEIMSMMFKEIARFSKGAPQHDDMTMVVIRVV